MQHLSTDLVLQKLLIAFLLLCGVSGIINIGAELLDLRVLRLWKEAYILALFGLGLLFYQKSTSTQLLTAILGITLFIVITVLAKPNLPNSYYLYQLKTDFIPLLFLFFVIMYFRQMDTDRLTSTLEKIRNVFLIVAVANGAIIILEFFAVGAIFKLLGLSPNQWGTDSGIRIISTFGFIRPPGLLSSFVQSGMLMFTGLVLAIYFRPHKQSLARLKYLTVTFLFVCLILTTYKTAYLSVLTIMIVAVVAYQTRGTEVKKTAVSLALAATATILFISTSWMPFSDFVANFSESVAERSFATRTTWHQEVIARMSSLPDVIWGLGYGRHGTEGLTEKPAGTVPLDSTYIHLLANYGFAGLALFGGATLAICKTWIKNWNKDLFGFGTASVVLIIVSFPFNNIIANAPNNYFLALTISCFIYTKKADASSQRAL